MSGVYWSARGAVLLMDGEPLMYLQRYNRKTVSLADAKDICARVAHALNVVASKTTEAPEAAGDGGVVSAASEHANKREESI